jgi:hypothetical protein
VWNYARSAAQIQATMNQELPSAPGLIGRWGLNEGSGASVADSGSSGSTGTLVNGPSWTKGYPFAGAPQMPAIVAPADGATVDSTTPTLDVVVRDPDNDVLTVTFYGRAASLGTFARIGAKSGVASGSDATIVWSNLQVGRTYEWFAQVSDGVGVTTGATASFTTSGTVGPVFVGAGDIASCASSGDEATAAVLDGIAGTVFTLGDNAYDNGTAAEYANCYDPSWGRHKARTVPVAGNHDYYTLNASGYYGYFGAAAGDPTKGYYSLDLGTWHIIVLNGNCAAVGGCQAGSPQEMWLRADLVAHPATCTLALWHQPRFSSGTVHPSDPTYQAFWEALYYYNADLILAGHSHGYERFAPQTPAGAADAVRGIREIVAGTGGESHTSFGTPAPNSEVRDGSTYGVLKLTLKNSGYDFEFVPIQGATFTDSGSGSCH